MQKISAEQSLSITPGKLVSLMLDQGRTIRIACGRVWVTIEGDVNDYWLCAGDTLALAAVRHIVIEADPAFSRIDWLPQCAAPARHERGVSVGAMPAEFA